MHRRADCVLPFRRGTRPFKAFTAALLVFPAFVILLLLLDRRREEEASLRRARAALGSGALAAWPCALDLPRKGTTLGDLLALLGTEGDPPGKKGKKGPQEVLLYHRPFLPRLWTPAPPPLVHESIWEKIRGFVLSLGERRGKEQQQPAPATKGHVRQRRRHTKDDSPAPADNGASSNGTVARAPPMSTLADITGTLWNAKAQHGGIFKTTIAGLRHKQSVAALPEHQGWACELTYTPGRAAKPTNKLPDAAAADLPVRLPFDASRFSFPKASALDLLFLFKPPDLDDAEAGEGEHQQTNASHPLSCSRDGGLSALERRAGQDHAVLINPYPIGNLSSVIAPFALQQRPQDLFGAEDALRVALAFAADVSTAAPEEGADGDGDGQPRRQPQEEQQQEERQHSRVRVGFNSMGACASVNHLHFQVGWQRGADWKRG